MELIERFFLGQDAFKQKSLPHGEEIARQENVEAKLCSLTLTTMGSFSISPGVAQTHSTFWAQGVQVGVAIFFGFW